MTFLNTRCHNLQGLEGASCYQVVVNVEVESKQIVSINTQLSRSSQGVVTDAMLAKMMMYHWCDQKITASVAGT